MTYTWKDIEGDWLSGAVLDISPDEAVTAFNCLESIFGRAWIEAKRTRNGSMSRGAAPTLHVIEEQIKENYRSPGAPEAELSSGPAVATGRTMSRAHLRNRSQACAG